jgi:UDP-glucuronate 4-epimerase
MITGGAGFIGSRLARMLQDNGHTTIIVDNMLSEPTYPADVKYKNLGRLDQYLTKVHEVGICNPVAIKHLFEMYEIDAVLHLAARAEVRESMKNPAEYFSVNATGTMVLVKAAIDHGVDKFIYASSSSVYSSKAQEDHDRMIPSRELDYSDRPTSPYAASKKAGELALVCMSDSFKNATILRFFNVYGPRSRPDLALFKFTRQMHDGTPITRYGDGANTYRDYTYVDDICMGIMKAIGLNDGLQIINLGGGEPVKLNDMINRIRELMGDKDYPILELPWNPCDPIYNWSSIIKAKQVLGWEPTTSFEDGTEIFMRWFKDEYTISGTS